MSQEGIRIDLDLDMIPLNGKIEKQELFKHNWVFDTKVIYLTLLVLTETRNQKPEIRHLPLLSTSLQIYKSKASMEASDSSTECRRQPSGRPVLDFLSPWTRTKLAPILYLSSAELITDNIIDSDVFADLTATSRHITAYRLKDDMSREPLQYP